MRCFVLPLLLVSSFLPMRSAPAQVVVEAAADKSIARQAHQQGMAAVQVGKFGEAIAAFRKACKLAPDDGRNWHMLGYSLHGAGKLDEALEVHIKAATFKDQAAVATYNIACVHSLRGDKDQAFEHLGKASALGFNNRTQLENDPDMDNLRADPRFKKLLESMVHQLQVFAATTPRESSRLAYFGAGRSPGQIVVDYAPVAWQAGYAEQIQSDRMVDRRWRLGADFWTTLDTSVPLEIGGVAVPRGYWYLTLVKRQDGQMMLGVHEPEIARKMQLDASACGLLPAKVEAPLQHKQVDESRDKLQIKLAAKGDKSSRDGRLIVHFGPHVLHADLRIAIGKQ